MSENQSPLLQQNTFLGKVKKLILDHAKLSENSKVS